MARDLYRRLVSFSKTQWRTESSTSIPEGLAPSTSLQCNDMMLESVPSSQATDLFRSPSQASYYSDDGFCELIRHVDVTKVTVLATPSPKNLGKRKADDLRDSSESSQSNRPFKQTAYESQYDVQGFYDNAVDRPEVIAHSTSWQPFFDKNLCYGAQYEIARLVSSDLLDYHDLCTNDINKLGGSNVEAAPKAFDVLEWLCKVDKSGKSVSPTAKAVWKELDQEVEALKRDELAGLGFSTETPDLYGGKVEFRGRVEDMSSTNMPQYRVVLEKAELGTSCRFSRRFGSMSFLRIKIPEELLNKPNNKLIEFFSQPFILSGRVFRSFYAKDDHIFLFRTNETLSGPSINTNLQTNGISLLEFLEWHNPLEFNAKQSMAKWAARFGLGLSSTIPGIRLHQSEVQDEPDIVSSAGSDMTDGCGFISRKGLLQLYTHVKWKTFPTAIQCRLGGAKGLLILRPETSTGENPTVWLRPSQVKIKYPKSRVPDPASLIIDIFPLTHMKTPGRLTSEALINLAENGVPHEVFVKLLQDGLDDHIAGLIEWEGVDAPLNLWCFLARKVKILAMRKARQASLEARTRGFDRSETDIRDGDDGDDAPQERVFAERWDEICGCPSLPEEMIMVLLDSGFTPKNCPILLEKLKRVVINSINSYVQSYSIDVPMSCTALLVPDPFGVLGPNEVQIKCREKKLRTTAGFDTALILGDILLTRYPCKLPTDIQKFVAVEKPELHDYVDVIVCSIQGLRRLADLLAGGDYDGDIGWVTWQPEIVDAFIPAELKHADIPSDFFRSFSKVNETVTDFLKRTASQSDDVKLRAMQQVLLGSIRDSSVIGKYSIFHENATYHLGYDHAETLRLAHMFCHVLDGFKTGLTVLPETLRADTARWQSRGPYWKKSEGEKEKLSSAAVDALCNRGGRPPFVMDVISKEAIQIGARKLQEIEKLFSRTGRGLVDLHLTQPWRNALKIADRYHDEEYCDRRQRDLKQIADHVKQIYSQLRPGAGLHQEDDNRSAQIEGIRKKFVTLPLYDRLLLDKCDVNRLKASFAYLYDAEQEKKLGWSTFPWDMAWRELCAIKAEAIGSSKTITMKFYEKFIIKQYNHKKRM